MPSSLLGGLSALRDRSRGAVAALGLAGGNVDNSATPLWVHGSFDDVRRLMAWAIALCLLLVLGEFFVWLLCAQQRECAWGLHWHTRIHAGAGSPRDRSTKRSIKS